MLKELRVKVERYNIYEHKNEIATLPQTFKDVNVNAIEEYREISTRYEFLKGQHDDLYPRQDRLLLL